MSTRILSLDKSSANKQNMNYKTMSKESNEFEFNLEFISPKEHFVAE